MYAPPLLLHTTQKYETGGIMAHASRPRPFPPIPASVSHVTSPSDLLTATHS